MSAQVPDKHQMTDAEFREELKGSLLILTTSSPDKRDIYRELFSSHAKGEDHYAGLDLYYTDSGALGLAPRKTPEKNGEYSANLDEKARLQLHLLQARDVQENIRLKLMAGGKNEFDPQKINIIGMTEDSGWTLQFADKDLEKRFINVIKEKWKPKLREQDQWLLQNLDKTGFPGPNLKPIQEHLPGQFHELVEMIYDAADELGIKNLRFANSTNVSFVSPRSGKYFSKTLVSEGRMLTRDEYHDRLLTTKKGEAINSNFVHIPDGQVGEPKTVDVLIREGLHTKASAELPASYARRELTEYLQGVIGKRRSTGAERKREVSTAFVSPKTVRGEKSDVITIPHINDLKITKVPTTSKLLHNPHAKVFDDADVIVLIPENIKVNDNRLRHDPNLGLLLSFVVTAETDPESMGVPIVLDNRSGGFSHSLELISDAFAQGRIMGDTPFYAANTDEELERILVHIKDVKQRAPVIKTPPLDDEKIKMPLPKSVPNDGVFTVFVGGGHANNSKRDLEDAMSFGYYCAEQGWRIVTGGGSVEGSMGAMHTGFVQYHLDQLQKSGGNEAIKTILRDFVGADGKYDAEKIILEKPGLIDEIADKHLIPRDMFYAYSLKPLLEMESPSGKQPPGITYFESGNRVRRLAGLLAAGTKVFLPGGIGTDEEFEETVKQHLAARMRKENDGIANDIAFSDGTPDDKGTIIVYNRDGNLDRLLKHYRLAGNDPVTRAKREKNHIVVISSLEELKSASANTAQSWLERISAGTSKPGAAAAI